VVRGGEGEPRVATQRPADHRDPNFETFVAMEFHVPDSPSGQYTYYPGTSEIPQRSAANVHNVSYKVLAEVELAPGPEGVTFAHGSRFGGHALLVKDGEVAYAYNFLGVPPEDRISAPIPTSGPPRGRDPDRDGPLLVVRRRSVHRVRQRRPRELHVHVGFPFTGGTIKKVVFDIADDAYVDVEAHLAAAMARD
jgi:hypothetical protein